MSESGSAVQAAVTQPGSAATVTLKSPFQRKTDVFDSEDFDPVKFVNQIYPDGEHHVASSGCQLTPASNACFGICHQDRVPEHLGVVHKSCTYMLHLQNNIADSVTAAYSAFSWVSVLQHASECYSFGQQLMQWSVQCCCTFGECFCSLAAHSTAAIHAEASLGDLGKFIDMLRKQVMNCHHHACSTCCHTAWQKMHHL
jgi:hypothetical protein